MRIVILGIFISLISAAETIKVFCDNGRLLKWDESTQSWINVDGDPALKATIRCNSDKPKTPDIWGVPEGKRNLEENQQHAQQQQVQTQRSHVPDRKTTTAPSRMEPPVYLFWQLKLLWLISVIGSISIIASYASAIAPPKKRVGSWSDSNDMSVLLILIGYVFGVALLFYLIEKLLAWSLESLAIWVAIPIIYLGYFILPWLTYKAVKKFDRDTRFTPMRGFIRNNGASIDISEMIYYLSNFLPSKLAFINANRAADAITLSHELAAQVNAARKEVARLKAVIGARTGMTPSDAMLESLRKNDDDNEVLKMYLRRVADKVGLRVQ